MSAQEPINEYVIMKSSFGAASSWQLLRSHHCRANGSKAKPLGVATGSTRTCPFFLHVWSAEVPSKRQAFSMAPAVRHRVARVLPKMCWELSRAKN
jgi:hypothetical protein